MGERNPDVTARLRPALRDFEPYDPAFSPCRVNLSANENTHALPDEVRAAIGEALLATPLNRYPDPMANALRDAVAARYGVAREAVCVGNGGDELLFNLLFAFGGRSSRARRTLPSTPTLPRCARPPSRASRATRRTSR